MGIPTYPFHSILIKIREGVKRLRPPSYTWQFYFTSGNFDIILKSALDRCLVERWCFSNSNSTQVILYNLSLQNRWYSSNVQPSLLQIYFVTLSMSSSDAFFLPIKVCLFTVNKGFLMTVHPLCDTVLECRFFTVNIKWLLSRGIKFSYQLWSSFPSMSFALNNEVLIFSSNCLFWRSSSFFCKH